jgi:hypothetical protein
MLGKFGLSSMLTPAFLAVMFLVVMLLSGCSDEPFDYVNVAGKVTYEDGSLIPAERIQVTFLSQSGPLDAKTHPRPGLAEVNVADGTFDVVTSHKFGDGVVPGKHKVLVVAVDMNGSPLPVIPREYASARQTPHEVDTADTPFHFKVRKPE